MSGSAREILVDSAWRKVSCMDYNLNGFVTLTIAIAMWYSCTCRALVRKTGRQAAMQGLAICRSNVDCEICDDDKRINILYVVNKIPELHSVPSCTS